MKLANVNGRAALVIGDEIADLATVTSGAFGPDPMAVYEDWPGFLDAVSSIERGSGPLVEADLRCAVPAPRQVFAIGLNYGAHAAETGREPPGAPATFTKFPACLSGPFDDVELVGTSNDWEIELVVVIGVRADHVTAPGAWGHVAGLAIGQDISDRHLQFAAGAQFSLGKSHRTYGPIGPWVVTTDELPDPDDLALRCSIDGEVVQEARTSDLIFDVPALIAELSAVVPLLPGDVIFTGTPSGVGVARTPQRFLQPGETIESWIEGIGSMRNRCVRAPDA